MKKYPINYEDLKTNFGTEKQCIDYLYNLRWENGFCCTRCQCNSMWQINERKYKCKECGYQTTVTSGTYLQGTHLPLTVWFEAIWHIISQRDKESSALDLQHFLKLGNNRTALKLLDTIRKIMKQCESKKLCGDVYIDDVTLFTKRYKADTNSILAVEMINNKVSRILLRETTSVEYFIENYVEKGSVIHFKRNRYYKTVPDGYSLVLISQAYQHRRNPAIVHVYRDLKAIGLYGSTQRSNYLYPSRYYCLYECTYKYNRRDKSYGEMFYEILYNAVHMQT